VSRVIEGGPKRLDGFNREVGQFIGKWVRELDLDDSVPLRIYLGEHGVTLADKGRKSGPEILDFRLCARHALGRAPEHTFGHRLLQLTSPRD
jgi:hypothetical protein